MSAGLQTVHVRVNDAATGKPTPVRIRFTGEDGTYYAPLGRLTEFALLPGLDVGGNVKFDEKCYAYIDGACEIALPSEPIQVEIHKGPEYLPVHETVALKPGKLALRFEIRRWIDMRERRWFSGDTHCYHLSPHGAILEGAAEDLAVVNLLAGYGWTITNSEYYVRDPRWSFPTISSILAFSGQRPALEQPGCMVVVNTTNSGGFLGLVALLNCHRLVHPFHFGPPDEPSYNWTLADLGGQCHRKGGLVVALTFGQPSLNEELLADAVQGLIDAIEIELRSAGAWQVLKGWRKSIDAGWLDLIDAGVSIPLVSGSGKNSNSQLLGGSRTYALLLPGEEFSYKAWIEAVRAGRTFATSGPMLFLEVDGASPGARLEPATGTVRVTLSAKSLGRFTQINCFFNGAPIQSAAATQSDSLWQAQAEFDFPVTEPGWFYASCHDVDPVAGDTIRAITSPIYVSLPGRPLRPREGAVRKLLQRLDEQSAWVARSDQFENEQQRQRMANVYLTAKQRLEEKLADAVDDQTASPRPR